MRRSPAVVSNPLLLTLDEAAARAGISTAQFNALVKEKIFPESVDGTPLWNRKILYETLEILRIRTDKVSPGFVYFMEMGDFIKIGWSTWPESRRADLQTSNPYDIKLLGAFPGSIHSEAGLHTMFASLRGRGEWFRKSDGLLAYIAWLKVAWRGDPRVIKGDLDNVVSIRGKVGG